VDGVIFPLLEELCLRGFTMLEAIADLRVIPCLQEDPEVIDKFLCRHWGDVQVAALNAATQSTWTTRARKRCRDEYEEEFLGDEESEEMDEERGDVEEREKEVVLKDEEEEEEEEEEEVCLHDKKRFKRE